VIQTYQHLKSLFKQFKMPKVNRRRSHSRHVNSRRSIEIITSNETETFSSDEEEEILINPNADIDHVDFSNESVLNDISDLFSFYLELEAKQFVFEECSKTEASFTAGTLPIFIDNSFYELNNLEKVDQRLVRSVERCKLDLRRFGAKFTANSSRSYFLGHEREDVNSVSAAIDVGGDNYFDDQDILSQFKRLFQLLPFKNEYKNHNFVCILDNARTHTAADMHINDCGMRPETRCAVDKIDYIDENNKKQTIEWYDDDRYSKGLLALAYELNAFVPKKCKLNELKLLLSQHTAFKSVSKLEKLAAEYNVKILFPPKCHCETNPIEGYWCHSKQYLRKNTDQSFQRLLTLIPEAKTNFIDKHIHPKLFRRFWRTIKA
ncbi:unnamed protein product, partial [Rotaria magnacalcarata]